MLTIDLYEEIVSGTQEVFSSMLMLELESGDPTYGVDGTISSNLTSMLGLGGDIRGMVAIHCQEDVAKLITSEFLGMDVNSLDEDVKDAIGEIANMVAGNLKMSFEKDDVDIQLAIPTSVIGTNFKMSGFSKANCISIPFSIDAGKLWVEFKYSQNS